MTFQIASLSIVPPLPPTKRKTKRATTREERHAQQAPDAMKLMVRRAVRAAEDALNGSVIGQMFLGGVITTNQYAASQAYSKMRGRHDRAIGLPRRSARSPVYGDIISGPGAELPERVLRELKSDHQRMILVAKASHVILDRVLLDDEEPAEREMERLKHALDRMAWFFGIGEQLQKGGGASRS